MRRRNPYQSFLAPTDSGPTGIPLSVPVSGPTPPSAASTPDRSKQAAVAAPMTTTDDRSQPRAAEESSQSSHTQSTLALLKLSNLATTATAASTGGGGGGGGRGFGGGPPQHVAQSQQHPPHHSAAPPPGPLDPQQQQQQQQQQQEHYAPHEQPYRRHSSYQQQQGRPPAPYEAAPHPRWSSQGHGAGLQSQPQSQPQRQFPSQSHPSPPPRGYSQPKTRQQGGADGEGVNGHGTRREKKKKFDAPPSSYLMDYASGLALRRGVLLPLLGEEKQSASSAVVDMANELGRYFRGEAVLLRRRSGGGGGGGGVHAKTVGSEEAAATTTDTAKDASSSSVGAGVVGEGEKPSHDGAPPTAGDEGEEPRGKETTGSTATPAPDRPEAAEEAADVLLSARVENATRADARCLHSWYHGSGGSGSVDGDADGGDSFLPVTTAAWSDLWVRRCGGSVSTTRKETNGRRQRRGERHAVRHGNHEVIKLVAHLNEGDGPVKDGDGKGKKEVILCVAYVERSGDAAAALALRPNQKENRKREKGPDQRRRVTRIHDVRMAPYCNPQVLERSSWCSSFDDSSDKGPSPPSLEFIDPSEVLLALYGQILNRSVLYGTDAVAVHSPKERWFEQFYRSHMGKPIGRDDDGRYVFSIKGEDRVDKIRGGFKRQWSALKEATRQTAPSKQATLITSPVSVGGNDSMSGDKPHDTPPTGATTEDTSSQIKETAHHAPRDGGNRDLHKRGHPDEHSQSGEQQDEPSSKKMRLSDDGKKQVDDEEMECSQDHSGKSGEPQADKAEGLSAGAQRQGDTETEVKPKPHRSNPVSALLRVVSGGRKGAENNGNSHV